MLLAGAAQTLPNLDLAQGLKDHSFAVNLAYLTGWKQSDIEARMETAGQSMKGK